MYRCMNKGIRYTPEITQEAGKDHVACLLHQLMEFFQKKIKKNHIYTVEEDN